MLIHEPNMKTQIATSGMVLSTDGEYSAVFAFRPTRPAANVPLGRTVVRWTRLFSDEEQLALCGSVVLKEQQLKDVAVSELSQPFQASDVRNADFEISRDLPTVRYLGHRSPCCLGLVCPMRN